MIQSNTIPLNLVKQPCIHSIHSNQVLTLSLSVSFTIKSHIYNSRHKPHKHAFIDKYDMDSNEISCFNKAQYEDDMFYSTSNEENTKKYRHKTSHKGIIQFIIIIKGTTRVNMVF